MWSEQHNSDLAATETLMLELAALSNGRASDAALAHLQSGGKRIRARLALSAGHALGLNDPARIGLAAAAELVHNASLIHDDIQDRSLTRRGTATLWAEFGRDTAICSGDLLVSAAYMAVAQTRSDALPALLSRMHLQISEVISGQCAYLQARSSPAETLQHYEEIAHAKSAPLLALPLDLALVAAGRSEHCATVDRAAGAFAIAYQMADDIADIEVDRQMGEPNIVIILGGQDAASEQANRVRAMAASNYTRAADLAGALPNHCGDLLVALARKTASQLTREYVPA